MSKSNYKAWDIKLSDYPKNGTIEEKIIFFTRFGILAANIHNTQPWLFDAKGNTLTIYPNWDRQLLHADPQGKNLFISLGCCIKNIECIAAYCKFTIQLKVLGILPKQTKIEIIFIKGKANQSLAKLATFITKRYSNKVPYDATPVQANVIKALKSSGVEKGMSLTFTNNGDSIKKIADLQEFAMKSVTNSRAFVGELVSWLRHNNTKLSDGMPGFVVGMKPLQAKIAKVLISKFPPATTILAKNDRKVLADSPLVGFISGEDTGVMSWINIGRTYQALTLKAFSLKIHITPMHSVIENTKTSKKLSDTFGLKGKQKPQFLFRMGYSTKPSFHTPRKVINDVFINGSTEKKLVKDISTPISFEKKQIGNYVINYVKAGKGEPLLLLHAMNIGWGEWYPNITEFSKHFTVYALDLPGAGASTRLDFEKANFDKDFVEVVEAFISQEKLKKVNIVGHSSGALVALRIAQRKKIESKNIVAISPIGFTQEIPVNYKLLSSKRTAKFLSKTVMKPTHKNMNMFLTSVMQNKNISKNFLNYYTESITKGTISHPLLLLNRFLEKSKLSKRLLLANGNKITNKTLIIVGDKDPNIKPLDLSQVQKIVPKARIELFDHCGHVPSMEYAKKFNTDVIQFME